MVDLQDPPCRREEFVSQLRRGNARVDGVRHKDLQTAMVAGRPRSWQVSYLLTKTAQGADLKAERWTKYDFDLSKPSGCRLAMERLR